MPTFGSQEIRRVNIAYFFYECRQLFCIILDILAVFAFVKMTWTQIWLPLSISGIFGIVAYMTNFKMATDLMFYQPTKILMKNALDNTFDFSRLVIGIKRNDTAKAYPI